MNARRPAPAANAMLSLPALRSSLAVLFAACLWIGACAPVEPVPELEPLDALAMVDPDAEDPPWQLWADVRRVAGAATFDRATADWLPARAAQALAEAGPSRNEGRLFDGLWRLELQRDELLARLEKEGVPRAFPLARPLAQEHWRVLLQHWLNGMSPDEGAMQRHRAVIERWGGVPHWDVVDPVEAYRILEVLGSQPSPFDRRGTRSISHRSTVDDTRISVRIDESALLLALDLDRLDDASIEAVLWILDLGVIPEGFDLPRLQRNLHRRVRDLERRDATFESVARARLQLERVRRRLEQERKSP